MDKLKEATVKRWNRAVENKFGVKKEDDVWVKFHMRVSEITTTQIFGFTEDGKCVSAPIDSVVDKFPRLVSRG